MQILLYHQNTIPTTPNYYDYKFPMAKFHFSRSNSVHKRGERFDEDPFLIFRLRGRTREQVMQELRKRHAGSDEAAEEEAEEVEVIIPLEEQIENFWEVRAPLEGFAVSIRPPAIEMRC